MGLFTTARRPRLALGTYGPPLLGRRFWLDPEAVASHKHVIGLTGQGKSKLLASIFVQLLEQGEPAGLIDPHGDLATDILRLLIERGFYNKADAYERVLYMGLGDREKYLPFNVLRQPYPPHDIARHVVEACKRAWPALADGSAPQFENVLLAASFVLAEASCSLADIPRLLTDKAFREGLLSRTSDPAVVSFFHDRFDRWGRDAPAMIESTLRRVFLLTFSPTLRFSLGAGENLVEFRRFMDDGVSVIFDLGGLDEDTQRLLGCLLTVGFEVAAMSRADTPVDKRRRYHLILDEFAEFSAQSEEALARILSLARKYGLFLTMAHQTFSQVSSRLHGALQNAVEVAFRLGRNDAEWAAPLFGRFDPLAVKHEVVDPVQIDRTHPVFFSLQETFEEWAEALTDLRPREAYVKVGSKTARIRTLEVPSASVKEDCLADVFKKYDDLMLRPRPSLAVLTFADSVPRPTRFLEVKRP